MRVRVENPLLVAGESLRTARLLLRAWKIEDLEDFYEYARDERVGPRAGWKAHDSIETTRKVLEYFMESKKVFAIEELESGKLIGSLGVDFPLSQFKEVFSGYDGREIGYVLNHDYWNRGYMSEGVGALTRELFYNFSIDYLVCGHFQGNLASQAVIRKTGFQYMGDMDYVSSDNRVYRTLMYYQWNPKKEDPFKGLGSKLMGEDNG